MKSLSLWQLKELVKQKYSLIKALQKVNPEGNYQVGQTCFCPFHDNQNTPSASIYDDDKGQTLYCFSEQKLYTVNDVFTKLMNRDIYEVGNSIWKQMSDEEQYEWLIKNSSDQTAEAFSRPTPKELSPEAKKSIELFKNKKIKLDTLLEKLIEVK